MLFERFLCFSGYSGSSRKLGDSSSIRLSTSKPIKMQKSWKLSSKSGSYNLFFGLLLLSLVPFLVIDTLLISSSTC